MYTSTEVAVQKVREWSMFIRMVALRGPSPTRLSGVTTQRCNHPALGSLVPELSNERTGK